TASPKINIDFFFDYSQLGRWFTYEDIVYDDGTSPGKPNPTIYQKAAGSIGLAPEVCGAVEDAIAGGDSANGASRGAVFIRTYSDEERALYEREESDYNFDAIIEDFNHFLEDHIELT